MNLKKINYLIISLLILVGACVKPDNLAPTNSDWDGTQFPVGGGLLDVTTPSLNYVVGEPEGYFVEFGVLQGRENFTTNVDVYKTFYAYQRDADGALVLDADGNKIMLHSNEFLQKSITVTDTKNHFESFTLNYTELINGLTFDGGALPTNDGELNIGDYWELRLVSTTADGNVYENYQRVAIGVSTRYAGSYKCVDALYFRIGVLTYVASDWPEVTVIKSIDAVTYQVVEYAGAFEGNTWYFQVNEGVISYPEEWAGAAQLLNGMPMILCGHPDMTNVNCGSSNIVVKDDVEGKDQLFMSFGYYTAGSGARTFYQVLEKIVD